MPTFRLTLAYLLIAEVSGNIFPSGEDRNIEETTSSSTAEGAENTDVNKQEGQIYGNHKIRAESSGIQTVPV